MVTFALTHRNEFSICGFLVKSGNLTLISYNHMFMEILNTPQLSPRICGIVIAFI